MSIPAIDILNENIKKVQRRRKWFFAVRQISLSFIAFVALFVFLGFVEMKIGFTLAGKIILFAVLLLGAGALVGWCIRAIKQFSDNELELAHYVEEHIPDLQQRLLTSIEYRDTIKQGVSLQLLEKLFEDARVQIQSRKIEKIASPRSVWPAAASAFLFLSLTMLGNWMFPDLDLAGRQILWPWANRAASTAFADVLVVEPGDSRIPRGEDVTITATPQKKSKKQMSLYYKPDGVDWQKVSMSTMETEKSYLHFIPSVEKDFVYYVNMGRDRSKEYRISVFDPLRVEKIDVSYQYPEYTRLKSKTEENGGDVAAPKGTRITLRVNFNKPLENARLEFKDGLTVNLNAEGTTATGEFIVKNDTLYTIDATDIIAEKNIDAFEYFVQAVPDAPPELKLVLPGKDRRVMPLEEVPIAAVAGDDYGLTRFALKYSIAGGEDYEVPFLNPGKNLHNGEVKTIDGKALIYLEDLAVTPGDFVTLHLTAADNNLIDGPSEIFSDIYFLQVVPTDEEFRKAPQMGGGNGSGGRMQPQRASALVENQKNVIAATWKLLRRQKTTPKETLEKEIKIVAESQQKVMQRTRMSLQRLTERFSFSDDSYDLAVTQLTDAVTHMETATKKLLDQQLKEALGPETAALQAILKAESESRVTQILLSRMQNGGGLGNGGQNLQEREDLRDLFKMEMGRLENRYEIPPQAANRQQQAEQEGILKKLRELARRQEQLNRDQQALAKQQNQMTEEQKRRRLEQLRREQEKLSRQSSALSRRMSRLTRGGNNQELNSRQQQLDRATRQMQDAAKSLLKQNLDMAASKGRKALDTLKQQEKQTASGQPALLTHLMDSLGRKAQELKAQEKQIQKDLDDVVQGKTNDDLSESIDKLDTAKEKLKEDLKEVESLLRAVGTQGRKIKPEVTDKAVDTLRMLKQERVGEQIQETQDMLSQGLLGLTVEKEKRIGRSIDRISKKLENLNKGSDDSKENPMNKIVTDAGDMRRALESIQQQMDGLRQGNPDKGESVSQSKGQASQKPGSPQSGGSRNRGSMNESYQRIRQYAEGLLQPWGRGESWYVNARSIHRELTQKEIEDFLSQPDLWKQLLEDVRELESALRAKAELLKFEENLFLSKDGEPPDDYRQLIEEYYRNLSNVQKDAG